MKLVFARRGRFWSLRRATDSPDLAADIRSRTALASASSPPRHPVRLYRIFKRSYRNSKPDTSSGSAPPSRLSKIFRPVYPITVIPYPNHIPKYWTAVIDKQIRPEEPRRPPDENKRDTGRCASHKTTPYQIRLRILICEALGIPHIISGYGTERTVFVPLLYAVLTKRHFREVEQEKHLPDFISFLPERGSIGAALACLSVLLVWHFITENTWRYLPFSHDDWIQIGGLDTTRVLHGEIFRVLTALTLHADAQHLLSNLIFGAPFFILLCRRTGASGGSALALLAGMLGNAANTLYRDGTHICIGFSTALFGIVGVYTGLLFTDEIRLLRVIGSVPPRSGVKRFKRCFTVLAVGVAVLALLGTDPSEKTDYAAHIFGLIAGIFIGITFGLARQYTAPNSFSVWKKLVTIGIAVIPVIIAWAWAVLSYLGKP